MRARYNIVYANSPSISVMTHRPLLAGMRSLLLWVWPVLAVILCVLPKQVEAIIWGNSTQTPASSQVFNAVATDQNNSTFIAVDAAGAIYISNDYGAIFTRQVNLSTASALNDVVYNATEGVAIAVRENGEIWTSNNLIPTQDAGGGWTNTLTTGTNTQALYAVTFDGTNAVAVGNNGVIFYSNDKGQSWSAGSTGYSDAFNDVAMSGTTAIAVGNKENMSNTATIFYSNDVTSANWTQVAAGAIAGTEEKNLYAVDFNGTYAVAVGEKIMGMGGDPDLPSVYYSPPSGGGTVSVDWELVTTAADQVDANDIRISGSVAIVGLNTVGGEGEVWKGAVSGSSWTDEGEASADIFAVALVGSRGYAVGASGVAGETTDSGDTWSFAASTGAGDLNDVEYNSLGARVVAVGNGGDIVYNTDVANLPPYITSNDGTSVVSINVAENTTAVTDIDATDPNSDTITYGTNGGADEANFSIVSGSGVLTFSTAPDFENPTDTGSDNTYTVIVTATDAAGTNTSDIQTITVTVTDAAAENAPPVITSNGSGATAGVNAAENQTAVTTVTATDPDADTVTFSITGGVDQAFFSIVGGSGVLTFQAAPDFETPADNGSNNTYVVEVTATDNGVGTLTDVQ
ncbi:MAG: photosystem II stability/assembly factor-like uncharacterized protein, partial [Halieaceae bacterium]